MTKAYLSTSSGWQGKGHFRQAPLENGRKLSLRQEKERRRSWQIGFLLGGVLFWGWGCTKDQPRSQKIVTIPSQVAPPPTLAGIFVATARATYTDLALAIEASGHIQPRYSEVVVAGRGGQLLSWQAYNNRMVKQGEAIGTLDCTDLELQREKLLDQQVQALKNYESELLGYASLLRGKSLEEAETVKQKLRTAAGLTRLEIDFKQLEYEQKACTIRAPISGVLSEVKVQAGMHLRPGQELFRIYSAQDLYAEVRVLETDLPLLRLGLAAEVVPLALPNQSFPARLSEINPSVDPNGMVQVRLRLLNTKGLMPGMNADAAIQIPQRKAIVVPKAAVVMRSGKPVVFSFEEGSAYWHDVVTGLENRETIEIQAGLEPNTEVIISNNLQLGHLAPVKKSTAGTAYPEMNSKTTSLKKK